MKKFNLIIALIIGVALFYTVPALSIEKGPCENIKEYIQYVKVAPKGPDATLSPLYYAITACEANKFLTNPPGPHRTIYADDLVNGIDDPDKADVLNDFFVIDIRSNVDKTTGRRDYDYCINGHIPGAVWIPFEDVAKPENLAKLPIDKPILVVCYTGHTASQINSILNLLGYNAWTLRFGMTSWYPVKSTAIYKSTVKQDIFGGNYSLEYCP